ncbi:MAG: response regulator [Terrimicrobiaceae bacterium]|nr:response regulator [Terrimicrobiaceae bacterium]
MSSSGGLVFLIDDDPSVRRLFARHLTSAGYTVETFDSASTFLARKAHDGPTCLILDVQMPGIDGLGLQDTLVERERDEQIVFISGHSDVPISVKAMKAGAVDFLPKPLDPGMLLTSVALALARSAERRRKRLDRAAARAKIKTLTPRELEVLRLVISGLLNKQIGAELGTTEKTVKVHRGRMLEKLGVTSVAELVRFAETAEISAAPGRT